MDVEELRLLMTRYQGGSLEAFEQIYGALAPSLRGYLTALTRNATLADDLVQDSFLQIHRSRHTYRADLPVRPWVFAIARHVWMMDLRTRSRRPVAAELPEFPVPAEMEGLGDRDALRRALGSVLAIGARRCCSITYGDSASRKSGRCSASEPMPPSCDRAAG